MDQVWEWEVLVGRQWGESETIPRFLALATGYRVITSKKKLLFSYHGPDFFLHLSCWQVHASGCPAQNLGIFLEFLYFKWVNYMAIIIVMLYHNKAIGR